MNQEIYLLPPTVAHQYLVAGQNGYLLIDVGMPNDFAHLKKFLKEKNISMSQIELVVITHADGDHFGCLAEIQDNTPSIVAAASTFEAKAVQVGESSRPLKGKGLRKLMYDLVGPGFAPNRRKLTVFWQLVRSCPF
jgi:glyoxylase-like metal-dependent hydrolase (beta-lactamase superfamily II)